MTATSGESGEDGRGQQSDARRAAWARIRERGVARFVLLNGLCIFGGLMFVGTTLLRAIEHRAVLVPAFLLVNALTCAAAGLVWAGLMWAWGEYSFRRSGQR